MLSPAAVAVKRPIPYFLCLFSVFCIWLVWKSVTPTLPRLADPPRLYVNPSREDLRLTMLSAIQKAKYSIFLCMFGLNDPAILKYLHAKEEVIPIKIYYDASGSPDVRKCLKSKDVHPVLCGGIMHHKILIIDDELVFLGSTNFTTPSLKMHDNLVIGFSSVKIAEFLQSKAPSQSGYLRSLVGGQDVEIWLLPDLKGRALSDLKKKIRSAQRSLKIALFTLTHPILVEEIIQAKKRGVDVKVVLDTHAMLGASAKSAEALLKAGVPIFQSQGTQLMHHKFMYIDERTLVTGSANWTKSAFAKNSDSILVLHNLNAEQKKQMKAVWQTVEQTAQKKNLQVR